MPTYTLPDPRYDYGALEPHISGQIMELHHDKHHAAYVKGANETLEKLDEARDKDDFTRSRPREGPRVQPLRPHPALASSGRTSRRRAAAGPTASSPRRSPQDFGCFERSRSS